MAFNPFHTFRKRQKTLLAILTIFVMFIFILSYGKGDAFDWFMSRIGAGRQDKDKTEVTTLYGKRITVGEVVQLEQSRRLANLFILQAIRTAATPINDQEVEAELSRTMFEGMFGGGKFETAEAKVPALRRYQAILQRSGKQEAAKYVAARIRDFAVNGLSFGDRVLVPGWVHTHPGQLYFGGSLVPDDLPDDLLDFLVWRQQADLLNITLTDDDVRREINKEADTEVLSGDPTKDAAKVRNLLGGTFRTTTLADVTAALRDEFRVRLAKEVLLGSAGGARAAISSGLAGDQVAAGTTPAEFWEYYKDNRTELKVDFLKVPVSHLIGQVNDLLKEGKLKPPTEEELQKLFDRYSKFEPSLERPTPGFKVPRRVKVEWVAADPQSPQYRQLSEKLLPALPDQRLTLLTLPSAAGGSPCGVAGACAPLALASVPNAHLQLEYEKFADGVRSWWDASPADPDNGNPYATLRRPETGAAVVGELFGALQTRGTPLSAAITGAGTVAVRQAEQKAHQAGMILAGANPFPLAVVAQEAAVIDVHVPPLAAVSKDLIERLRTSLATGLAQAALDSFNKEVEAKRSNKEELAAYIAKNANAAHGITAHEAMTEPLGETEIADAPALAPLKKAFPAAKPLTPRAAESFAAEFFDQKKQGNFPASPPKELYHPEPFGGMGDTLYYFWLTEKDNPYLPKFKEARPKVLDAWKLDKARDLARKQADEIVKEVKGREPGTDPDRFFKDLALRLQATHPQAGYTRFEPLSPIAKLVKRGTTQAMATGYGPYRFDEADIAYPRRDTVEQLFEALKNAGDVTVLKDQPDRNYYVALLVKREVPTEEEFLKNVYGKAPSEAIFRDTLWERFRSEQATKYRNELTHRLREAAQAPLDKQGNYALDPEVRRRLRGGSGE